MYPAWSTSNMKLRKTLMMGQLFDIMRVRQCLDIMHSRGKCEHLWNVHLQVLEGLKLKFSVKYW